MIYDYISLILLLLLHFLCHRLIQYSNWNLPLETSLARQKALTVSGAGGKPFCSGMRAKILASAGNSFWNFTMLIVVIAIVYPSQHWITETNADRVITACDTGRRQSRCPGSPMHFLSLNRQGNGVEMPSIDDVNAHVGQSQNRCPDAKMIQKDKWSE